jgi:toxin FitB
LSSPPDIRGKRILLDTSVVSQRIKAQPDERIVRWASALPESGMFLSVISLREIRFGIEMMPEGRRRDGLETWLSVDLRRSFAGRLLGVDDRIAEPAGRWIADGKKTGAEPEVNDALIAATAHIHGLDLATLNRKHFIRFDVTLVEFPH